MVSYLSEVWAPHPTRRSIQKKPVTNMATKICVVLTSSMVSIAEQRHQIDKTRQILTGNRIVYREVDCSLEENRSERDRYFEASNVRGNYPQVFLQNEDGSGIVYIGSFNEIEELNEASDIPPEILSANNISTLGSVFADVARRQ